MTIVTVPAQRVPAERRGRTEIPERVLTRIATQAAGEVPHVHEVRERGGLLRARPSDTRVHDELAVIKLDVAIDYPAPLRDVVWQIRRHVARRVHELTGMDVAQVNVTVTSLRTAGSKE